MGATTPTISQVLNVIIESFADWIFVRIEVARDLRVNHQHARRRRQVVGFRNQATAQELDVQRRKIIATHKIVIERRKS